LDPVRKIAHDVIDSLGITQSIRNVLIEETDSPWNEKGQIKRRKDHLDVKIAVWNNDALLYGRVFRLFLYVCDVLAPDFKYDPSLAPGEEKEPIARARYNQIWSLYVDSRMERKGIDSFFDRTIRESLFIEMERGMPWEESKALFQRFWDKPAFTYPEIIECSHNIRRLEGPRTPHPSPCPELEILRCIDAPYVQQHLERIESPTLRAVANDLLNFTAYNCKDALLDASYFGISFLYQRRSLIEFIPTAEGMIYFTFLDPESERYKTETLTEDSSTEGAKETIKAVYHKATLHSQS
jgi:hypothetical protein